MKQKGKSFLILTGLATLALHLLNRFEYSRSTKNNYLLNSENYYYDWRFGKVRYITKGTGSPILLLHDLTIGSSLYEYHKVIDKLSKKHQVYAIDFLGYGLSDKPDLTYTNYFYVQLITDFIKNVIKHKTDVVASCDAAPIAIMACHNDPEIINKLVAINPQDLYRLNQIPSNQTRCYKLLINLPIIGTFIYNLHASKQSLEQKFKEEYFYNSSLVSDENIHTYWEAAHIKDCHSKHSFTSYIGKYTNANIVHALKKVNNSIFIIAGAEVEDIKNIVDNYSYYNTAIESIYISKTKKLPHMEKPESVIRNINTFLDTL